MSSGLFCVLAMFVFPLAMFLLTYVIMCRETRYLWPFEPMQEPRALASSNVDSNNPYQPSVVAPPPLPISPACQQAGSALTHCGYTYLGAYRHAKGGIYQIRYDVMLSLDRMVLAFVEGGTLLTIPVSNLSLITLGRVPGDSTLRCIETITNESCYSPNYDGTNQTKLLNRFAADRVHTLHGKRIEKIQPVPFSDQPLNDLFRYRLQQQTAAIDSGYQQLLEEGVTRPTLRGAAYAVFSTYGFQLGRRILPHQWRLGGVGQVMRTGRDLGRTLRRQVASRDEAIEDGCYRIACHRIDN
jgi:hypothetical protein